MLPILPQYVYSLFASKSAEINLQLYTVNGKINDLVIVTKNNEKIQYRCAFDYMFPLPAEPIKQFVHIVETRIKHGIVMLDKPFKDIIVDKNVIKFGELFIDSRFNLKKPKQNIVLINFDVLIGNVCTRFIIKQTNECSEVTTKKLS